MEDGLAAVAEWEIEHGAFTSADLTNAASELAELDAQMIGTAGQLAG